jgi:Protein of unknown function (DUF778)
MGIALSNGVIRDFAGPYFVSEDNMAFGRPTKYLPLNPNKVMGGQNEFDEAVSKASVVYGTRMHNLFCDNCHSHVGRSLVTLLSLVLYPLILISGRNGPHANELQLKVELQYGFPRLLDVLLW